MTRDQQEILIELLVIKTQAGDPSAIGGLADLFQQDLVAYSFRLVGDQHAARDVVQETWISVLRGIGRLKDPALFRAWVFRIVHNKSMDCLRKAVRDRTEQADLRQVKAVNIDSNPADNRGDVAAIQKLIQELSPSDRALLALYYEYDLAIREIATVTGNTESAIKSKLYHLRQSLKQSLSQTERYHHEQ